MARWTEQGERLVNDVANRYGASYEAVSLMLDSILRGNGTMAQFNIYELGGCGQWMRGGMTMVGDMFNYQLKSKVDGICGELSSAVVDQNLQVVPPPPPQKPGVAGAGSSNGSQWWPSELGSPNTSGSQNQYRYAYFAGMRRLAISDGQSVTVYDTLDHSIGGVSQQQGGVAGVGFTSQYGNVDLRSLPLVSGNAVGATYQAPITVHAPVPVQSSGPSQASGAGQASAQVPVAETQSTSIASAFDVQEPAPSSSVSSQFIENAGGGRSTNSVDDIFSMIERLAKLRDGGALTEDEFVIKKTELLGRL